MSFAVQPTVLPQAAAQETPVFLDERGRRASAMRMLGVLGAAAAAAALLTILVAATSFSRLSPLTLPHGEGAGSRPALVAHDVARSLPPAENSRRQAALAMLGGLHHGPEVSGRAPTGNSPGPARSALAPGTGARVGLAPILAATAGE